MGHGNPCNDTRQRDRKTWRQLGVLLYPLTDTDCSLPFTLFMFLLVDVRRMLKTLHFTGSLLAESTGTTGTRTGRHSSCAHSQCTHCLTSTWNITSQGPSSPLHITHIIIRVRTKIFILSVYMFVLCCQLHSRILTEGHHVLCIIYTTCNTI